jgi:preprotein translocase subunit SecD
VECVLLLGILFGLLLFSAHAGPLQAFQQPSRHITLVASQNGRVPTPQALEQAQTILLNRFQHIGLTNTQVHVTTTHGQARISLDLVSLSGNEQQTLSTLLATGTLQLWDTGPATDPASLLQSGVTFHPTDYTQYNPGGKPGFANQDFNPNAFSASKDPQSGTYRVNFALQGSAITHFQTYTAARIGDVLTITLDDTVITSSVIQAPIPGSGAIVGNFTQAQANALAATLASGVLPIRLTPA